MEKAASLTDSTLRSLVVDGLAYHHAGLNAKDRHVVEQLFLQSAILVLFCTQTLALGVNLPARLVIVKGTTAYKDHAWEEYDDLEMLQIMGRAGRPQFDQQGVAVIMTETCHASRWQKIIAGRPLESRLPGNLTEALLAEVVAQTPPDIESLSNWLKSTFLAVRCTRDPGHYATLCPLQSAPGRHPLLSSEGPDIDEFLRGLSQQELQRLVQAGLITGSSTGHLRATALGEVASRFSVRYDTIRWLQQAPAPADLKELWALHGVVHTHGEKTQLRELAKKDTAVRGSWPLVGPVDSAAKKARSHVLVLVMLALADSPRSPLPWELKAQQLQVLRRAEPLLRVVSELFESRKEGLQNVVTECKSSSTWRILFLILNDARNDSEPSPPREAFLSGDPRVIELALNRKPPFGNLIQKKLRTLPRLHLRLCPQGTDGTISINLASAGIQSQCPEMTGNESQLGSGFVHCLAYAAPSGQLLLHRRFPVHNPQNGMSLNLQNSRGLVVHLIYEDFLGFDDLQVIGDVQLAPAARKNGAAANAATSGSKRQKVEALRGHEATFALARARSQIQGIQVQTMASMANPETGACEDRFGVGRDGWKVQAKEVEGFQKVQNAHGFQGVQGFQGSQGVQGFQGFQGVPAMQGAQGVQAMPQVPAMQGVQGIHRFQGPPGFQAPSEVPAAQLSSMPAPAVAAPSVGHRCWTPSMAETPITPRVP
eukprot:Skav202923  [mRNA]  locus=scaffold1565:256726:263259:- [translate_table: standard]